MARHTHLPVELLLDGGFRSGGSVTRDNLHWARTAHRQHQFSGPQGTHYQRLHERRLLEFAEIRVQREMAAYEPAVRSAMFHALFCLAPAMQQDQNRVKLVKHA